MFSGGDYHEVERWLRNFLISHARREDPRIVVELDGDDGREGRSYGARLRLGSEVTPLLELDFKEVADNRGSLAWCAALAERIRRLAREQLPSAPSSARR
jgi:hypothetical protein